MSVKLRLSKNQLEGLYLFVKDGLERNPPENLPDSLIHDLMDKLLERLRNKVRKISSNNKSVLSLTLSPIEAKTFHCWYQHVKTDMQPHYTYEVIVCDGIYRDIDRECA